jgi:cytochrome P450
VFGCVPWVEPFGLSPLLFLNMTTAVIRFRKSAADQVNHRIEQENAGKGAHDIFNLLLQFEDKSTGEKMGFKELSDEAVVLIIADKVYFSFLSPFPVALFTPA